MRLYTKGLSYLRHPFRTFETEPDAFMGKLINEFK
jgi:hypothetical protein